MFFHSPQVSQRNNKAGGAGSSKLCHAQNVGRGLEMNFGAQKIIFITLLILTVFILEGVLDPDGIVKIITNKAERNVVGISVQLEVMICFLLMHLI
jgi:hypothetical protein